MPLENLVNESLIIILSDVSIDLAHHFTELGFGDFLVLVHIGLEGLENILLEIAPDDGRVLKWVENRGDEV